MKAALLSLVVLLCPAGPFSFAEAPSVSYVFPAGGRRGTTVEFKVGGHYLYESCPFEMRGPGVEASQRIELTETIWFEGPVIPKPASQVAENYPRDYKGRVKIDGNAPLGVRKILDEPIGTIAVTHHRLPKQKVKRAVDAGGHDRIGIGNQTDGSDVFSRGVHDELTLLTRRQE